MPKITLPAARKSAGYTQKELAEKLGISTKTLSKIEAGEEEVKPVYLYAFCEATGFSMDDLLLPKEYA